MSQHPTTPSGSSTLQSRGPILIVDDDPNFSTMLRETISSWNLANGIVLFPNGEKLMDFLGSPSIGKFGGSEYPVLIILDLKMPGLTGVDVMRLLKKSGHTEVPVIIVSGSQDFPSIAETYELGAYCFISKPQRPGDLDKIKHALRIWN